MGEDIAPVLWDVEAVEDLGVVEEESGLSKATSEVSLYQCFQTADIQLLSYFFG